MSQLTDDVAQAFAPGGALALADERYVEREVQQRMAQDVAAAIDERRALVAEAGTGVGKTFAYLVPTLLSGKRALVSTATKSLQDQLFLRDLPRLRDALQLPVTLAIGDVNADGLPDVVSYWNTHMVLSYLATGVGNQPFSGPQVSPDVERIAQLLIAPLTGDDHADIALIDDSYQVRIMPGDGQGKFAGMPSQASYLIGQAPTALQAADMDKDGLTDLVFSLGAAGGLTVLFQDNGAFFTRESWGYGNGANGVVLGDYNGDNMPDMAQVGTGGISVYLSQPLP